MSGDDRNERGHGPGGPGEGIMALPGDERDLLVSRIIDGRAGSADWDRFRAVAAHDPAIWSELGDSQRQQEALCVAVSGSLAAADRVGLPPGPIDDAPTRRRLDLVSHWGGWAAAAALLLVWFVGRPRTANPGEAAEPTTASVFGIPLKEARPDQAFDQYLAAGRQSGKVVGEMPDQVVIETRPKPDGTIEVLYLRQVIERQVIDHAYRQMRDETGGAVTVPVRIEPVVRVAY